jgi:hypothetical protein
MPNAVVNKPAQTDYDPCQTDFLEIRWTASESLTIFLFP